MARQAPKWIWEQSDWPAFRWDDRALAQSLAGLRRAQGALLARTDALLDADRTDALKEFLIREGLDTSRIEGEVLDPNAVRSSVMRRLGMATAGLPGPEPRVEGLIAMLMDATTVHDQPLDLVRLYRWQAGLFPQDRLGIRHIRTGELRGDDPMQVVSGPEGRERVHYEAPPRAVLEVELAAYLDWFGESQGTMDGLLRAGLAHLWFETLHPFEDGNGRVGRAVAEMAIAQDEGRDMRSFSLSGQLMRERDAYYAQLEAAQRSDLDVTPWLAWFLEQLSAAVAEAGAALDGTLQRARFWMRHRDLDLNARQRKVLNRMLDEEPQGFEGGMTNRKYRSIANTSFQTATRDLADLVEKGCLLVTGAGRSTAYRLADL